MNKFVRAVYVSHKNNKDHFFLLSVSLSTSFVRSYRIILHQFEEKFRRLLVYFSSFVLSYSFRSMTSHSHLESKLTNVFCFQINLFLMSHDHHSHQLVHKDNKIGRSPNSVLTERCLRTRCHCLF